GAIDASSALQGLKPYRRSGRLASSSAVEWRVHRGVVARLPARRASGNCQGAQETTRRLLTLLCPRDVKGENFGGGKAISDEQIEQAIEAIQAMLEQQA